MSTHYANYAATTRNRAGAVGGNGKWEAASYCAALPFPYREPRSIRPQSRRSGFGRNAFLLRGDRAEEFRA
jgi:hypothetical protein